MAKYDLLSRYLQTAARPCHLTFAQIDSLIGGLPPSARAHREGWGNDPSHMQARAWLSWNRRVGDVDIKRATVHFD